MKTVYAVSENIISSLGFTSRENLESLLSGKTGITVHHNETLYTQPVPLSLVDSVQLEQRFESVLAEYKKQHSPAFFTRLEKMLILSAADALRGSSLLSGCIALGISMNIYFRRFLF